MVSQRRLKRIAQNVRKALPLQQGGFFPHSSDPESYPYGEGEGKRVLPFNPRDRRLLEDPETWEKVEEKLTPDAENKEFSSAGYNWNIFMVENPITEGEGGKFKRETKRGYFDHVKQLMEQEGVQTAGHITFVKNRSTGEPMTPWMIFHTMGHGLLDVTSGSSPENRAVKQQNSALAKQVLGLLNQVAHQHYTSYGSSPEQLDDNQVLNVVSRLFPHGSGSGSHEWKMSRTSSMSTKGSQNLGELFYDLFAQFLWTGAVTLTNEAEFAKQDVPGGTTQLPQGGQTVDVGFDPLGPSRLEEGYLQQVSGQIQDVFKQVLENSVGHVFYHYRPAFGRTTFIPEERRRESRRRRVAQGIRRANSTAVESVSPGKTLEQAVLDWETRSGKRATVANIINVLRHEFTTYDRVWRRVERTYAVDPCAFLRAFHDVIYNTWDTLSQIISKLYRDQPQLVDMLETYNSGWAERKLKTNIIPPECEEE